MKKILNILFGVILMSVTSCMEIDNWDAPDSTFHGTVYDSYTQKPLLTSQNDWQIHIWERSFGETGATAKNDLRIKQDGTYQNTKLFAGTYDMIPYDGPFWPVDTAKNVVLKKSTQQDFTVTPYIQIVNFEAKIIPGTDSLKISYRVKCPLFEKNGVRVPNLYDVRFFISFTSFCGNGQDSNIGFDEWHSVTRNGQKQIRRPMADVVRVANGGNGVDTSPLYELGPIKLRRGYIYSVRGGANTDILSRRYNYSEIVQIDAR